MGQQELHEYLQIAGKSDIGQNLSGSAGKKYNVIVLSLFGF